MPQKPQTSTGRRRQAVPQQTAAPANEMDPAGSTQMFRAFVADGNSAAARPDRSRTVWAVLGAALVVAIVAVVVWASL